jgi:S-adenosyl-L-methionine hydrolase (adenosine-forming)
MNLLKYFNNRFVFFIIFLAVFIICSIKISCLVTSSAKKQPYFALLTDFGYDFAVGSVKGVILKQIPGAIIIDLDHSIDKFNITSAGFVLAKSYQYFPQGTIFICVVDPGVGTQRVPICITTPSYCFIGPNNGLFDFVLEQEKICNIYRIDETYLLDKPNTFHGRDLFAPAAVDFYKQNLAHFLPFDNDNLSHAIIPDQIIATYIDSFGNVKTNKLIDSLHSGDYITLSFNNKKFSIPFVTTFKEVAIGQLLCYVGSNRTIEIAINQGSAADYLHIKAGDQLSIEKSN